jgi:hypothetical protein
MASSGTALSPAALGRQCDLLGHEKDASRADCRLRSEFNFVRLVWEEPGAYDPADFTDCQSEFWDIDSQSDQIVGEYLSHGVTFGGF